MSTPISINLGASLSLSLYILQQHREVCGETSRDGLGRPLSFPVAEIPRMIIVCGCVYRQDWIGARLSVVYRVICSRSGSLSLARVFSLSFISPSLILTQ